MVKIINYETRRTDSGDEFYVLILQGDVEMIQSKKTGKFYATTKNASLPCTFNEETCKGIIGKELKGHIEKVECEAYEYANPNTGEFVILTHRYEYVPETQSEDIPTQSELSEYIPEDVFKPSMNGKDKFEPAI